MRFESLPEWLAWQETLHFKEIDPGLERISQVWHRLMADQQPSFKVVTIAGTNGKGSSVAMVTAILRAAGYLTGSYTSPHLMRYNERIAIDGEPASDADICSVFQYIDTIRQDISLTYFEFATLAAAVLFTRQQVDIAVLEVGMGGRLDAVNLFDADVALITPIGLDHTTWLGDTRELIGAEKAGILRAHHPLVCSETAPPQSVIDKANSLACPLYISGQAFSYQAEADHWSWQNANMQLTALPKPALLGNYQLQNAAAVLQAITLLNALGFDRLDEAAIRNGLANVVLNGRFQILPGPVERIFDVTHNTQGAENLATLLQQYPCEGQTHAVVAMLRDKDSVSVFAALQHVIDQWYLGGLKGERGQSAALLSTALYKANPDVACQISVWVQQAYHQAMSVARPGDRILIFGSFHTVEAVMKEIPECAV